MAFTQLTADELATIRALREEEELTFAEIGERLGIDTSVAHRILARDGYAFEELSLIRIRKGLARLGGKPSKRQRMSA